MKTCQSKYLLLKLSDKSMKYNENKKGSEMEPCGTPAQVSFQDKHWPLKAMPSVEQGVI